MKIILPFIICIICINARAEYRVYQYSIKNKIPNSDKDEAHFITTTLDPRSYLSYHGGAKLISLDLLRTWICPGNTSRKKICNSPYQQALMMESLP